ncbi:hypothetical protein BJX63DRAFT_304188 [Aspergillus granulosus]|uniref:Uncharacterized protein n=1 Tax=Aspergillus granulosus TaxID=176169 RepID=A0ABR4H5M0_9EURO
MRGVAWQWPDSVSLRFRPLDGSSPGWLTGQSGTFGIQFLALVFGLSLWTCRHSPSLCIGIFHLCLNWALPLDSNPEVTNWQLLKSCLLGRRLTLHSPSLNGVNGDTTDSKCTLRPKFGAEMPKFGLNNWPLATPIKKMKPSKSKSSHRIALRPLNKVCTPTSPSSLTNRFKTLRTNRSIPNTLNCAGLGEWTDWLE